MADLRLGWATHAAAKHACENWHYAGILPTGKLVRIGVWEGGEFVGVVVYSRGASPFLGKRYALDHTEICELTRIALREHETPVSRIIAISLRMLRRANPGLRLVVSFADPHKGHHGGVYQAAGWIYTGRTGRTIEFLLDGRWIHVRGAYHKAKARGLTDYPTGIANGEVRIMPGKYRYVYPLDPSLRPLVELNARPYPKREDVVA